MVAIKEGRVGNDGNNISIRLCGNSIRKLVISGSIFALTIAFVKILYFRFGYIFYKAEIVFPTYKTERNKARYNTCLYFPFLPGPVIVPGLPSVPVRPAGKGTFSFVMLLVLLC